MLVGLSDDVLDEQDLVALLGVDHLVDDLAGQKKPEAPRPQAALRAATPPLPQRPRDGSSYGRLNLLRACSTFALTAQSFE